MEQQIKALLSSPTESNQRLGCLMAKSILKWSNFDICLYILNSPKNWELIEYNAYDIDYLLDFLNKNISYCQSRIGEQLEFSLFMQGLGVIKIIDKNKQYTYSQNKPDKGLKRFFNEFIDKHL